MAFVAYAFVLFSRSFNSASSVFAFNGVDARGARYGFVSVWMLLLVYVSFAAGVYASTADIAGSLLASLGVHLGWVVLAVSGWALTMVFAYVSFGLSSVVILVCEGLAIVLVAVVGDRRWWRTAAGTTTRSRQRPFQAHGIAFSVLGLGWSTPSAPSPGSRARRPSARNRPPHPHHPGRRGRLAGRSPPAVYIVFTWIVDNAYASPAALAADPAPWSTWPASMSARRWASWSTPPV